MTELSEAKKQVITAHVSAFVDYLNIDLTKEIQPFMDEVDAIEKHYQDPKNRNWLGMIKFKDMLKLRQINKKLKVVFKQMDKNVATRREIMDKAVDATK